MRAGVSFEGPAFIDGIRIRLPRISEVRSATMAKVLKSLAPAKNAPNLQTPTNGQDPKPVTPPAGDAGAFKTYVAWCVASKMFPYDTGTDPGEDISDEAQTNPDALATGINSYAPPLANHYSLTWTDVTTADTSKLKTVQDLENLVIANLS